MGDERWEMEDERWEMEDERWEMEDGRWEMEDSEGRWKIGDGRALSPSKWIVGAIWIATRLRYIRPPFAAGANAGIKKLVPPHFLTITQFHHHMMNASAN